MKPVVLGIVIVLAILVSAYMFVVHPASAPAPVPAQGMGETYGNDAYGFSFTYPDGYLMAEQQVSEGHFNVLIIREEDAAPMLNGEGPTAVTVDVYEGPLADGTLTGWLTLNESNFHLGDGTYDTVTVDGTDAVHYKWSGLYEGETIAFLHNGNLIAVSVTYFSPSDAIRVAYQEVLATFALR